MNSDRVIDDFRHIQIALLRAVLKQARDGSLEQDWRERLPVMVAESDEFSDDADAYAACVCAGREIVDVGPQEWEPNSGVG